MAAIFNLTRDLGTPKVAKFSRQKCMQPQNDNTMTLSKNRLSACMYSIALAMNTPLVTYRTIQELSPGCGW